MTSRPRRVPVLHSRTVALVHREAEGSMLALQLLLAMAAQAVERGHGVRVLGSPRQMLLHIRGDIAAKEIIIFGLVDGDIRATGRAELRASANVQGNIFAAKLSIEDNATFRGQVDPERAQEAVPDRPAGRKPAAIGQSAPALFRSIEV